MTSITNVVAKVITNIGYSQKVDMDQFPSLSHFKY